MKNWLGVIFMLSVIAGAKATDIDSSELNKLYSRLSALEERGQQQDLLNTKLQGELNAKLQELQGELNHERLLRSNIQQQLTELKQQQAIQTKVLLHKRQSFMETVAFHATLDQKSGLEHIRVGSTIPFPNIKLNIGGGYDNTTSTFTATTPGLYIFSVSISSYWNDHGELHVGVMKNGVYLAGAYVDDIGGPPEQGSVTIPMQLQTGDKVLIKHVVHDDGALYGEGLTSFMGCLVFPL